MMHIDDAAQTLRRRNAAKKPQAEPALDFFIRLYHAADAPLFPRLYI